MIATGNHSITGFAALCNTPPIRLDYIAAEISA